VAAPPDDTPHHEGLCGRRDGRKFVFEVVSLRTNEVMGDSTAVFDTQEAAAKAARRLLQIG
jgi:hypothetical protein